MDVPPPKKLKVEDQKDADASTDEQENGVESLNNLSTFKLDKIFNNNTTRKSVCLKGTFQDKSGDALILLEKTAFAEDILTSDSGYFSEKGRLEKVFHNDIYGNYQYFPETKLNSLKATIVHPATEKHFEKYATHKYFMIDETPEIYERITLPSLESGQLNLKWVYNILEHKSETERIVFEDSDKESGFILLPDLKWNGEVETLYLLGIAHKPNIKSLRDLNSTHLPLLRNIQQKGIETIKSKYGLSGQELRIYLHYQPSFYHLHVHFTYIRHEAPGILAERAHLLSNVISNIELLSDYYQKVTLPFTVRENDDLYKKLKDGSFLGICKNE